MPFIHHDIQWDWQIRSIHEKNTSSFYVILYFRQKQNITKLEDKLNEAMGVKKFDPRISFATPSKNKVRWSNFFRKIHFFANPVVSQVMIKPLKKFNIGFFF